MMSGVTEDTRESMESGKTMETVGDQRLLKIYLYNSIAYSAYFV